MSVLNRVVHALALAHPRVLPPSPPAAAPSTPWPPSYQPSPAQDAALESEAEVSAVVAARRGEAASAASAVGAQQQLTELQVWKCGGDGLSSQARWTSPQKGFPIGCSQSSKTPRTTTSARIRRDQTQAPSNTQRGFPSAAARARKRPEPRHQQGSVETRHLPATLALPIRQAKHGVAAVGSETHHPVAVALRCRTHHA
eukprot:362270-Chlamydomonas_euryale.AAC.3